MDEQNTNASPNAYTAQQPSVSQVVNITADVGCAESHFDGGLLGLIGINLLVGFLCMITAGLAYPWAICIKLSWKTRHTVINGRRLRFTGTGIGLFGNWIKWFLLTLVTFGIYGFWMTIKVVQWEVKHTVFE